MVRSTHASPTPQHPVATARKPSLLLASTRGAAASPGRAAFPVVNPGPPRGNKGNTVKAEYPCVAREEGKKHKQAGRESA